jgi:hypothetical protein
MKTFKSFGQVAVLAILASCGQNNATGTNQNQDYWTGGAYGNNTGAGGAVATVMRENPCRTSAMQVNGQRSVVQVQVNMQVDPQRLYVGITSEGDVASIQASGNGGAVMTMHICNRPGAMQGQGQLYGNPVVGFSQICRVDEIQAAYATIPSQGGYPYQLSFRPLAVPGAVNNSPSLCGGQQMFF